MARNDFAKEFCIYNQSGEPMAIFIKNIIINIAPMCVSHKL